MIIFMFTNISCLQIPSTLIVLGRTLPKTLRLIFLVLFQAVVTPLGFLFWTIFRESPFGFHPAIHITTWFSIAALVPMVPSIFLYNTGPEETDKKTVDPERSPLLQHKQNGINEYT
ncbi:crt homolog 2-like [Paramuricea clavata]|uniref:Crt homolog 2-like n=1 Tax=Paramuricea clavata TaxID=317549 RepID=A0A6S7KSP6_PARCT|nr:crt homolog 2-like [Paramuricea clavata]